MDITATIRKKTLVVALAGELDHHTSKELKSLVEEIIKNQNIENVIFDFSKLDFMDSSGIGVIVGRYKLINSLGGKVAITGAKNNVRRILLMSGIDKIIESFDTNEHALDSLQEEIG